MEGETFAPKLQTSEWEVYNDALAPPQPTRRAKPWERVPVPAHALRLHGQKIWKKAGINTQPTNSKAADEAQAELEREGMGARKRSRHMGGKEDISNAKWSQSSALNDENRMAIPEILSPIKKDSLALDLDALVVPRKRTNANHLITPRKASKKIPLQDLTQIPAIATKLEDGPLLKQLDATSNNPQSPASSNPARRTKSMRRSSARLSQSEDLGMGSGLLVKTSESNMDVAPLKTSSCETIQELVPSQPVDIFGTSLEAVEEEQQVEIFPVEQSESGCWMEEPATLVEPGPNFREHSIDIKELHILREVNILPTHLEESIAEESPSHNGEALLSKKMQGSPDELVMFTKSIDFTGTSGSLEEKKASPRKSGTSRSSPLKSNTTRLTRSSSLLPETQPPQPLVENVALTDITDQGHSPGKPSGVLQQPKISDITPVLVDQMEDQPQDMQTNSEAPKLTSCPSVEPDALPILNFSEVDCTELQERGWQNKRMDEIQPELSLEEVENLQTATDELIEKANGDVVGTSTTPSLSSGPCSAIDHDLPDLPDHEMAEDTPSSPVSESSPEGLNSDSLSEAAENHEELEITVPKHEHITEFLPTSTLEVTESVIGDAASGFHDEDDTHLLRNFLDRVKANKAAKATTSIPKRKRSLPHSPIQVPLGTALTTSSPCSPKNNDNETDEFDVSLPVPSPSKRRRKKEPTPEEEDTMQLPRQTRRSGRTTTRLPVKSAPLAAPSFIPVRRLGGQDGDNTITLRRDAEKELAMLTKFNTRKNKGGALLPPFVLAKKAEEKSDPAAKHKALKDVFDDLATAKKGKNKKGRNVVWAEELAQFQTASIVEEPAPILPPVSEEKRPVKVGVRSKMSLSMVTNGTPAPKRQLKPRKK